MAYTPTNWENREVERPRTYTMVQNDDGTITLTPAEGQVFVAGTPIEATVMNKLEQGVADVEAAKVDRAGDTLSGPLTATVINATTNLQEQGVNLDQKYQAKGSYQPAGSYATTLTDTNGTRINCGKFAGTGKPIILYLTSAQPSASSAEHRVWIQIDNF